VCAPGGPRPSRTDRQLVLGADSGLRIEPMFDSSQSGSPPDVSECPDDPAVRLCSPPVRITVDLHSLAHRPGQPYRHVEAGVFGGGAARGYLWAWIATDRGTWLGVTSIELERSGQIVLTAPALVPDWALQVWRPGRRRRR
jgi:hypothetical protein